MDSLAVAKLYWKLLELQKAQAVAEEALARTSAESDPAAWGRLALFTARLYQDTFQTEKMQSLLNQLEGFGSHSALRSPISYLQGLLAAEVWDLELSHRLFEVAEVSAENEEDLLRASYGLAMIPYFQKNWAKAREALQVLQERMNQTEVESDLLLPVLFSLVKVETECGDRLAAAFVLERARFVVRSNHSLSNHVLLLMAEAYFELSGGQLEKARQRVEVIERLLPDGRQSNLGRRLEHLRASVFEAQAKPKLILKRQGFKSQLLWQNQVLEIEKLPQLERLIVLLTSVPGKIFSKEEICEQIWQEEYHPLRHDNKIYVTIRRLRGLLRGLISDQEVIIRQQEGYLFQPEIEFQLHSPKPVSASVSSLSSEVS